MLCSQLIANYEKHSVEKTITNDVKSGVQFLSHSFESCATQIHSAVTVIKSRYTKARLETIYHMIEREHILKLLNKREDAVKRLHLERSFLNSPRDEREWEKIPVPTVITYRIS